MGRGSQYDEAFKREAARKAQTSGNVLRTARELGIASKTLHQWIRAFGTPKTFNPETATVSELNAHHDCTRDAADSHGRFNE